jgi:hypothetical protein
VNRTLRLRFALATRLVTSAAVVWFGWVAVPPAEAAEAVLVGAGDIAGCSSSGDSATARLVEAIGGTVFTLGDNAYQDGTRKQFESCYGPTWGRFKNRTRPAIGNHEYQSSGAKGYWDYFGARAGQRGKGWYSYEAGPLKSLRIETRGEYDLSGYMALDPNLPPGFLNISYTVDVDTDADPAVLEEIRLAAENGSPVAQNVLKGTPIRSEVNRI